MFSVSSAKEELSTFCLLPIQFQREVILSLDLRFTKQTKWFTRSSFVIPEAGVFETCCVSTLDQLCLVFAVCEILHKICTHGLSSHKHIS